MVDEPSAAPPSSGGSPAEGNSPPESNDSPKAEGDSKNEPPDNANKNNVKSSENDWDKPDSPTPSGPAPGAAPGGPAKSSIKTTDVDVTNPVDPATKTPGAQPAAPDQTPKTDTALTPEQTKEARKQHDEAYTKQQQEDFAKRSAAFDAETETLNKAEDEWRNKAWGEPGMTQEKYDKHVADFDKSMADRSAKRAQDEWNHMIAQAELQAKISEDRKNFDLNLAQSGCGRSLRGEGSGVRESRLPRARGRD